MKTTKLFIKSMLEYFAKKFSHLVGFRKLIITLLSLFITNSIFSQRNNPISKIDSLSALLKTDQDDTNKAKHLNDLGKELMYQNPDTAILFVKQALELSTFIAGSTSASKNDSIKKSAERGIAYSSSTLGTYYWLNGDYSLSLWYHFESLQMRIELKDKNGICISLNNIGLVYNEQGEYPKALEYYFEALKLAKEIGNKNKIAIYYGNIGIVYNNQRDYPRALKYYNDALELNEEIGSKNSIAANCTNIGIVYKDKNDYTKALENYNRALNIYEEIGNKNGIAANLNNIGAVDQLIGDYPGALEYYFKALKLNEELGNKTDIALNLHNIGELYTLQKKYKEGEQYLLKAVKTSTEIGSLSLIQFNHETLSKLYSQTNRYQLAYEHYKQYTAAKDSLFNEDKSKEIGRLEMQHEIEIAEMERERIKNEELKIKHQKKQRKHLLQYSGIIIGLLIIGLLITFLGFIKVKPWVAEGITFFSFLLFFEFLLVLLDPYMDKFTRGEPAYKLLINALVAACIFPAHAFFEKMLMKRLMKKKL